MSRLTSFYQNQVSIEVTSRVVLLTLPLLLMSCSTASIALNESLPGTAHSEMSATGISSPAEQLRQAANSIKAQFGGDGHHINYKEMIKSPKYVAFKQAAESLKIFDLKSLKTTSEKLAFWINVYNSLVIQGVAENLSAEKKIDSVWDIHRFFSTTSYTINGLSFTLDDIENGILRANRRGVYSISRQFSAADDRLKFSIPSDEFDPRIHFALNCGSHSCPPFAFYSADRIKSQLETAKCGFINADSTVKGGEIFVSKIFDWYSGDFKPDARSFLESCADGELKAALSSTQNKIRFSDYNWHLNNL